MKKLTPTMLAMLRKLAEGKDPKYGLRGMSERGGASGTLAALRSRGFIEEAEDRRVRITDAGRAALEASR